MRNKTIRLLTIPVIFLSATVINASQPSIIENWVHTQTSPGVQAGVLSTKIETFDLSDEDKKSIMVSMATVSVSAQAYDTKTKKGQPARALGQHTACFGTFLTTEADYKFILNVGGNQTVISNHIVIPANKKTCITNQTYQIVNFPVAGSYMYTASSYGNTYSSGVWDAHSNAYITVE